MFKDKIIKILLLEKQLHLANVMNVKCKLACKAKNKL